MTLNKLFPKTWNPNSAFERLFYNDPSISSQALSDLFILATIYLAGAFLIAAMVLTIKSLYRSKCYRVRLKKVSDYASHRESLGQDKNLTLFRELNHHLIEIPLRNGSSEFVTRRTIDAEEIFSDVRLAPGLSTSRIFQMIPAILTGLGVLGTFVGLQLGIGGLDLSNLKELDKSIIPLIQGCAIAFSTSVWGVGVSLIFGFLEKLMEGLAIGSVRKLQHAIDSLIPRYVPEEAMADLARSSRGSEDLLKGLATAIGEKMQEAIGRLGKEIKDAVEDATTKGQGPLAEKAAQLLATAITSEIGKLKETIDGMGQRFTDDFSKVGIELASKVGEIAPTVNALERAVSASNTTVTNAVTKLNAHEEVMSRMSDASANIKQAADSFVSMNGILESSASRNKEAAEAQNEAAKTNQEVVTKLSVVGERMPEMKQSIEQAAVVIGSLAGPIVSLRDLLEKQRVQGEEFEKKRSDSESERSEKLLKMYNDLADTVTKAVQEFAKVGKLAEQLNKAAATLDDASNELAVFGQQVIEASKEQRSASEASRDAAQASRDTTTALIPLPAEFRDLTTSLGISGSQLRQGIETAVGFQNQWLRSVELQLIAQRDSLSQIVASYGTQMEGQTRQLIEQWTTAVVDCINSFDNRIDRLEELGPQVETIEGFNGTIERMKSIVESLDDVVSNIKWEE